MSAKSIRVVVDGEEKLVESGILVGELAAQLKLPPNYVVARKNNEVVGFHTPLKQDCQVQFLNTGTIEGMRAYRAGLTFLFVRAAQETLPGCTVFIKHSLSNGLYGEIEYDHPVIENDIQEIEKRMKEIVAKDDPFEFQRISVSEGEVIYEKQNFIDKLRLLASLPSDTMIPIYRNGDYYDYLDAVMVPSTGILRHFKLRYYLPGFILEYPRRAAPELIPPYVEQGKLFNVFFHAEKWQQNLQVSDVAALNECIEQGRFAELIHVSEANQEKQIGAIADLIARERDRLRVILIAGPSSSGKTTFAERLTIQLRVNGLWPVAIGLDDYFVNRDQTPIDEDGEFDFEALEAIDLPLFNEHLTKLIQGEKIELPRYDFKSGTRQWDGRVLQISREQPIIIEGIHGLNDKLTLSIPQGRKFKIYLSALTNLNIDNHTRISTTDARMLRRMVRDNQFRSHDAVATIKRWPLVGVGEKKHIFPFQEDADVMFNSSLVYELAVLKNYAEALLKDISPETPEYSEAQRLLLFLSHFRAVEETRAIPCNSILREFIGGSCYA